MTRDTEDREPDNGSDGGAGQDALAKARLQVEELRERNFALSQALETAQDAAARHRSRIGRLKAARDDLRNKDARLSAKWWRRRARVTRRSLADDRKSVERLGETLSGTADSYEHALALVEFLVDHDQFEAAWSLCGSNRVAQVRALRAVGRHREALELFEALDEFEQELLIAERIEFARPYPSSVALTGVTSQELLLMARRSYSLDGRRGAVGAASELDRRLSAGEHLSVGDEHFIRSCLTPPVAPAAVNLMSYGSPDHDRASRNLGDWVQSAAVLLNLSTVANEAGARLRLHEMSDIERLFDSSAEDRDVSVGWVDRDGAGDEVTREPGWLAVFGWLLNSSFGTHRFPYDDSLSPLFFSVHISDETIVAMPESIEYLQRFGPIGCRDDATVRMLAAYGIPAFFSGCVTTTIGEYRSLLSPLALAEAGTSLGIDVASANGESDHRMWSHHIADLPARSRNEAMQLTLERLGTYAVAGEIRTSRLHCYLPSRAFERDVTFEPRDRVMGDGRFDGLVNVDDAGALAVASRAQNTARLALRLMLDFAPGADAAYESWRNATSGWVQADRVRLGLDSRPSFWAVPCVDQRTIDIEVPSPSGEPVHVALATDQNQIEMVGVVAESAQRSTPGEMKFTFLLRNVPFEHAEAAFTPRDGVSVNFVDCSDANFGNARILPHLSMSTMDRLLLPDVLPTDKKVLYLDNDVLVRGDLRALFSIALDGAVLAARGCVPGSSETGNRVVATRSNRMRLSDAIEFRLALRQRHGSLVFPHIQAGVLLMNLELMRNEGAVSITSEMCDRYALHDQEGLTLFAGHRQIALPREWNLQPYRETSLRPVEIVHWAGPRKPWLDDSAPYANEWWAVADSVGFSAVQRPSRKSL